MYNTGSNERKSYINNHGNEIHLANPEPDEQWLGNKEDELMDYSQDDRKFLEQVVTQVRQRADGMIELPLPFRNIEPSFTNNAKYARSRTKQVAEKLKKHPERLASTLEKFKKNLYTRHPAFVPVPREHQSQKYQKGRAYWIPLFDVWKNQKARIVFDSATTVTGEKCLNDMLLQGPDRNNSLRGVLLRFRHHPYAFTGDIENMFHNFAVPDRQSTYMRFFWFEDNDPNRQLIEYWSKVHLMGNTSSPAVANLGIRYAARKNPPSNGNQWLKEDNLLGSNSLATGATCSQTTFVQSQTKHH